MTGEINIKPGELQLQIGKLNALYQICQSHKPDPIEQQGDGDSVKAIKLIYGEYAALQATLATMIFNASGFFSKALSDMSAGDQKAAEQFEESERARGSCTSSFSEHRSTPSIAVPKQTIPPAGPAVPLG
ncbi:DUF5344 family protein [Bifidobacterium bombi]|uniref:DUF5344 family protein n=1 Tax=Bifidobacterium bombi TaxID=471511 RepID=UPI000A97CDD8|nr:DUF5344 family protein [Bifidobacterium bombi]